MEEVAVLWVPGCVSLAAASVAAVSDLLVFRVRNALTIPLIASGLIYHALFTSWSGFGSSLLGFVFGLGILIAPWLLGLMGAGDAKLMGGVGAWLGLEGAIATFVVASLATGLIAMALIVYRGKIHESVLTVRSILVRLAFGAYDGSDDLVGELVAAPDRRVRVIPFAAMVPVGVVGALVWMWWKSAL